MEEAPTVSKNGDGPVRHDDKARRSTWSRKTHMTLHSRIFFMALCAFLSACSTSRYIPSADVNQKDSNWHDLRRSGAEPVTHAALEEINLIELLDPKGLVELEYDQRSSGGSGLAGWRHLSYPVRYDIVFARFATMEASGTLVEHRNLVQNRLVAASERRCGRFVQFLKKDNSDVNFQFAVGSSVFATMGALVPGIRAAQNLSGLSALSSGLRAEYNNEYYANLAVSVITKAIDEKRKALRAKLQVAQGLPYDRYDIAAAVSDGVQYDASCNIVNGLEQANEALQRLEEPSRDAINRALIKDRLARALASGDTTAIAAFLQLAKDLKIDVATLTAAASMPVAGAAQPSAAVANGNSNGASVVASAGKALGDIKESTQRSELALRSLIATRLPSLEPGAVEALTKTVVQSSATFADDVTKDFASLSSSASKNSCFVEAQSIASGLSVARDKDQLTKASGGTDRENADRLSDAEGRAQVFNDKLTRYLVAVREVTAKAEEAFRKALAADQPDVMATSARLKTELSVDRVIQGVGTARRCAAS